MNVLYVAIGALFKLFASIVTVTGTAQLAPDLIDPSQVGIDGHPLEVVLLVTGLSDTGYLAYLSQWSHPATTAEYDG
ncbi:hypothetical protein BJV78DRAFT_1188459 [Lactifluus subvellereus]|nr:hypothetical protein BJV78DRAFT_1188459 [Lactifluus subvellereus]